MPELLPEYSLARFRRITVAVVCALPLCGIPAGAWAQSVPAGLRACAAKSDPGQRLDCYDREMNRLLAPAAQTAPPAETAPPAAAPASAPPPAPAPTAKDAASSSGARVPAPAGSTAATAKPAAGEPATRRSGLWKFFSRGGAPSHVTARIVRVDRSPDAIVLHLDNGQVWRQMGRAPGDLGLRAGDEVTIDKHLGSYWLSSSHVSDMRVRQESR